MQRQRHQPSAADQLLSALIAQSAGLAGGASPAGAALPGRLGAAVADDPLLLDGGATVGGVQLLSLIGEGGMGRVYLGHHQTLDIEVAVKVMLQGAHAQAEPFVNEARLAARIQHANIVRTLHAGYEGARLFLVQEYVAGINLKQLLRQSGPLPWTQAVHFAVQAARGLGAAHQAGIVHRDIKPSNLLITPHCTLKIVDLGLAYDALRGHEPMESAGILGTPAYMAPEQARDCRKAGPRADVYALGVTLYHMLSGDVPYKRTSHTNLLLAHIHEPIPDIRSAIRGLPPALVALLGRMLAKDPAARPADGEELGRELDLIIASSGQGSPPRLASRPLAALVRRPQRLVRIACAVGALALLGAVLVRPGLLRQLPDWPSRPSPGGTPAADGDPRLAAVEALGDGEGADGAAQRAAAPAGSSASPWQTPQRTLVVHCRDLPADRVVAVHAALIASGLPVIDRDILSDLQRAQPARREQPGEAMAGAPAGQLAGGELAIDIAAVAHRLEVRAVAVASGELISDELVDAAQAGEAIARAIAAGIAALPARGWLVADGQRELGITLGSRHGVRAGDRFAVQAGDGGHPGAVVGIATVTACERDRASVRLTAGAPGIRPPALVSRLPPGVSDQR